MYSKEEEEFRIRLRNIKLRKFTRTKRLGREEEELEKWSDSKMELDKIYDEERIFWAQRSRLLKLMMLIPNICILLQII